MAIRQRGDSYQVSVTIAGQRYRKDFPTLALAEAWEADKLGTKANTTVEPAAVPKALQGLKTETAENLEGITLKALIRRCYENKWQGARAGDDQHACAIKALWFFGDDYKACDVTTFRVEQFKTWLTKEKRNMGSTVDRATTALSVVLKHGFPMGALKRTLSDGTVENSMPVITKNGHSGNKRRSISVAEENAMLKFYTDREDADFADLITFLIETFLRIDCEALQVEMADIKDFPVPHVYVKDGKFGKARVVPLSKRAQEVVQRCKVRAIAAGRTRLFAIRSYEAALDRWDLGRKALRLLDDPHFTPHGCRHTGITRALAAGANPVRVKEWAGHVHLQTTMGYVHLSDTQVLDARGLDTLDRMKDHG